jgi:hypothetical protein
VAGLHAPTWVASFVREGLSANRGLAAFRAEGGRIQRSVWLRIYREQRAATGRVLDEATAPLTAKPNRDEIVPMSTVRARGYLATIDVFTRLKGTDAVVTRPFMLSGQELLTRGAAVQKALQMMQTAVDDERYDEVILGAIYTGTRIMQPGTA